MYEKGKGTSRNYTNAIRWYKKAAEQGSPSAQYNLGLIYAYGKGVSKNKSSARKWLNMAKAGGHKKAENVLQELEAYSSRGSTNSRSSKNRPVENTRCSRNLKLTFDMAAGVDMNPRLSVNGPSSVSIFADGSYANINARGENCVNGKYSFNYAVEYSHLVDGMVPYNFRGSFSVGANTRACYITLSRVGSRPALSCS